MNAIFKQNDRMGSLSTILGEDVLNLLRFDGEEHLNGLFTYRLEALAKSDNIDFNALISTHATVSLKSYDLPETPFDGVITEGEMLGQGDNGWRYAFTLRPWFWLLGLRRKQQIYHNKTVVEILDELFAPYSGLGKPAVEKRLTCSFPTLEYTVQYRESDLDFATRLMERFGISYHFRHDDGSHSLVLTDTVISHDNLPGGSRDFMMATNGSQSRDAEHFWEMRPSQRLTTGKIRLTDYNFKSPNAAMETDRDGADPYAEGSIESYDYPGDYLAQGPGKDVARLRVEQERGQDPRHRAVGDCASLRAGQKVKVEGEQVPGVDKTLCLSANHKYVSGGYGTTENREPSYEGQYLLIPADAPLAPERKTALPIVQGPQTAVVVGEGEIDCDEYGRILVKFHWDLDARHSMRCRVSQNWAGKGWGGMVIPRIGMEVVVEFLEGDPDKPLVTGCVYNGQNDVPYPLPANKTKSVFRSDTHKGKGFNEFTFEDERGVEKIYLHGQKDHEIHIENDRSKRVDRNQLESVGRNKTIDVGNNHHEVIGGNMTIMVGPNKLQRFVTQKFTALTSTLGDMAGNLGLPDFLNMGEGNLIVGVAKNKAETVMLSSTEVVGGGKATTVGGGMQTIVGGISNTTVGIGAYEEVGQNKALTVGKQYEVVVGDSKILMQEDGTISITGKKILIDGSELVRITGKSVKIN